MKNHSNKADSLVRTDIEATVATFLTKSDSNSNHRYISFDYCYNYFQTTKDLLQDLEKNCLVLGFYLASWGMFRGSGFLMQKSLKHFQPTIQYIASLDKTVWRIDVPNYDEHTIQIIINIYKDIKSCLIPSGEAHLTLITKVLLGVFGFVPAFDNHFGQTFRILSNGHCGFRTVNAKSLNSIKRFYQSNQHTIDQLSEQTFTKNFTTGEKTIVQYSKAKIIDMFGFTLRP